MKIKVRYAQNGFIIEVKGEKPQVSELKDDESDANGVANLFWKMMDRLDCGGEYDEERVEVRLVHGSDWECKMDVCQVCEDSNRPKKSDSKDTFHCG